jgi:hypothetical protein
MEGASVANRSPRVAVFARVCRGSVKNPRHSTCACAATAFAIASRVSRVSRAHTHAREEADAHGTPLKLVAELDGDQAKENAVHRRLAQWHIHGEWFHYVPEVCEVIVDEISKHLKDLYLGKTIVRTFAPSAAAMKVTDPRIARFIEDCTVSSLGARTQSSKLYQAFEAWCGSLGLSSCTQKAFSTSMANAGYCRVTSNVVFFLDIKLKP